MSGSKTLFAPQLLSKNVLSGIEFYKKAFGAVELRRRTNPDGSVHVAEMSIEGAIFQIHEKYPIKIK
jgi:PhnB protein